MGKVIDKDTGKTLATFDKEEDGKKLRDKLRAEGKKVKMVFYVTAPRPNAYRLLYPKIKNPTTRQSNTVVLLYACTPLYPLVMFNDRSRPLQAG